MKELVSTPLWLYPFWRRFLTDSRLFLLFLQLAVRERLTGLAGLPKIFRLCAVGKEFQQAVLTFPSSSTTISEEDESNSKTTTSSIKTTKNEFKLGDGVVIRDDVKVIRGRMEVRRLEGKQGEGNTQLVTSPSDW